MKKKFFLLTLLSAGVLTLAACGDIKEVQFPRPLDGGEPQHDWTEYSTPISDIRIASEDREVILDDIGLSDTIEFSISPRNALKTAVDWVSSDESIATVSKDNTTGEVTVTAIGGGECDITASADKVSATAHVIVNVPLADFSLSKDSIDLDYGESVDITATFEPDYTTFKDLSWTASDPSITVVDGHVTAGNKTIENGTISVTSLQLDKVVVVTVNISDKWNYVKEVSLSTSATELEIDRSLSLESVVTPIYPERPASTLTHNEVRYVSMTPDILSVDEMTGEVTAIGSGIGKVKASLFDERKGESISSNEIEIEAYEVKAKNISIKDYSKQTIGLDNIDLPSITLEPEYQLDDSRKDRPSRGEISFSSSDESVATVSEAGVVNVVSKGSATITMVDSYANKFDFVEVEVTVHGTSIALASSATEAGVNRPITLSTTIATNLDSKDVSDPSVTFEAIPSENVIIENNGDGTATAISTEEGLVQFIARNGKGDHAIVSNVASVNFKYLFEENTYYLVGSRAFSGHGEGDSWDNAGKAAVLNKTEEIPEGYTAQYKVRLELFEGDQFKFRVGSTWLDTISWYDPGEGQEHIRTDHVENAGAVASGKIHVNETSSDYGNIVVDADGVYDIYFKTKLDGYDIYIGDAPVFRFEFAPKTVELNKTVEIKVSDWKEDVTISKNNNNVAMTEIDKTTGYFSVTGLVAGESTIISATDAEKTISYEINVVNQLADFTLAGSFNEWKANDQDYALEKVSEHHYVIENLEFAIGTELQAVSRESGDYFGNASPYEGCHYELVSDGYGKNKLVVDYTGTYNVHIYTDGTSNPIVLKLVDEDEPVVVYDFEFYVEGIGGVWAINDDYGLVDSGDHNHYTLEHVTLSEGTEIKVYSVSTKGFIGVNPDYSDQKGNCEGTSEGNLKVLNTGTYTIHFWNEHGEGNHIYISDEATPVYEYAWYLNLNGSLDPASGDMGSSRHFEIDPNDSNIYWVKDLVLAENDKLKAYNPTTKEYRGTTVDGDYWTVDDGDIIVSVAGTYDLRLFVSHDQSNHISLLTKQENFGTGVAMVGSRNYSGSGAEGESWNDATKAYFFTEEGGDPIEGVDKQYVAEFTFADGDLFRFRVAGAYQDILDTGDDSTAYKHGQIVKDGDNYKIAKAGTYTLYMKHYTSGGWSCYIGAIENEPVADKVRISIDLNILKSKFGSAASNLSGFSLYGWDSNKVPLLGSWGGGAGTAGGNLGNDGYVEINVDLAERIVGLVIYLWEGDTIKQSNDMSFTYSGAGEYYVILPSGDLSWSDNTFSTLSVQKAL